MKNKWIPLLFCLASLDCVSQEYQDKFDQILTSRFAPQDPGATVLVAKAGKVIYRKSFGKADLELAVPMKPEHVFRIGSLTKQFTASAILKLAEEGRLSLTDSITKFIKDYPTHGYVITIEQLLTHTSGIKNYTSINQWTEEIRRKDLTPAALIDFFKDEPMDFVPGKDYRYSNSGYILLGYIIEKSTGKSYAQYIQENVFQPLKMRNTFYDNSRTIIPNRIAGYQLRNGHYENSDFLSMTLPYSAGSLISNVDDLFTWHEAVVSGKVINKKSLEGAHTSFKLPNGMDTGYGYGWEIGNIQGSRTIKHTGRINGFVTFAAYLPDDKIFVTILSNCDCTDNLDVPASKMAAILLGKPYEWTKIELTAKDLEIYSGVYNFEHGGQRIIAYENGRLLFFSKGGGKSQLFPFGKDKFFLENELVSLEFLRNANGDIVSFDLRDTGIPRTLVRTDEKIEPVAEIKVAPSKLEKYVGKYQFPHGPLFLVVREGGKLYGQVGEDKKEILPFDQHKFFARDIDARIIFNLDDKGKVIGLQKIQRDPMTARRVE